MTGVSSAAEETYIRLCSFQVGRELCGIDSADVREVLGQIKPQIVPRAPHFVAGIIPYRGDVLLALSLPVLLGQQEEKRNSCAIVMKDTETGEGFALLVSSVADVVEVSANNWEANPATLDERRRAVFSGVYRVNGATIVWLESKKLQPSALIHSLSGAGKRGNG